MNRYQDDAFWPPDLGFLPYVGSRYDQCVDGVRVLILGESHYPRAAGHAGTEPERNFTRTEFESCETETESRAWRPFFRRLDQVLTGQLEPSPSTAADAWKYVAFSNFVQERTANGRRPSRDQWSRARSLFPLLLERLRPNVILVLGAANWENSPSNGRHLYTIKAQPPRNVWSMPFEGGVALMTWIYHPRARAHQRDTAQTAIKVYQNLLRLASGPGS